MKAFIIGDNWFFWTYATDTLIPVNDHYIKQILDSSDNDLPKERYEIYKQVE